MVVGDLVHEADVLVIGSGPGGYVAAIRAAQCGRKVTVVERAEIGGVCLNHGCIPSKAMITAAERLEQVKEAEKFGIQGVGDIHIEMEKLSAWRESVVQKLTGGIQTLLKANKIEVMTGEAYFTEKDRVRVIGEYTSQTIQFKDVVIATGSEPAELPHLRFDGKRILSSTELLRVTQLPKRLIVVGGGYIGLELGSAFAKLGSEVTILEGSPSLLPGTDPSLTRLVSRQLKKNGVNVITEAMVQGGESREDEVQIQVQVNGEEKQFIADVCLVAIGRKPNTDNLGIERIGIEQDERGFISINEQCQTNIPHIYAIGDCAGGALLAHKASYEGKVAAEVIGGQKSAIDYRAMPCVIFSDPEIAYTGLSEAQAKEEGYDVVVNRFSFAANGRALTTAHADGFAQMVCEKETNRILGMQIVGPEASNLIAEAVLAIEMGASAEDISLTIHAHPTLSEVVMEAAEGVMGHAIHGVNRK